MHLYAKCGVVKVCMLLAVLLSLSLRAQEGGEEPKPVWEPTYWRAELTGGKYAVAHDMITSIGLQEYIVDGTRAVTEVTVATMGSEIARFFFEAPVVSPSKVGVAAEVVETIREQVKPPVEAPAIPSVVNKIYPATTHAHVMEYRLSSRKALLRLYDNVEESWTKRKSMLFKADGARKE